MLLIVKTLKCRGINFKNEKVIITFIVLTPKLRTTDIGVHTPEFRTTDIKLSSIHMYSL